MLRPGAGIDPVGLLAAVGANLSFAIGVVLTKRFPAPANRLAATGWQLLLGGALLVPLTFWWRGARRRSPGATWPGSPTSAWSARRWPSCSGSTASGGCPAAAPPLLGLAAPVTGAVLGWVVLGQALSPVQLTGFVVTLAAIAYGASLGASSASPNLPAWRPAVRWAGIAEEVDTMPRFDDPTRCRS